MTGAPVYIAVDDGGQEIAIRLPKEVAMQLLTSVNPSEDMARVI